MFGLYDVTIDGADWWSVTDIEDQSTGFASEYLNHYYESWNDGGHQEEEDYIFKKLIVPGELL